MQKGVYREYPSVLIDNLTKARFIPGFSYYPVLMIPLFKKFGELGFICCRKTSIDGNRMTGFARLKNRPGI
jgi:hypothetical protein